MTQDFDIRTQDMPLEMQLLLRTYPRDDWEAHPGFKEKNETLVGCASDVPASWRLYTVRDRKLLGQRTRSTAIMLSVCITTVAP